MRKRTTIYIALLIGIGLFGCQKNDSTTANKTEDIEMTETSPSSKRISIQGENQERIVFQLNDSSAAQDLYDQLPMRVEVEDYGDNEKIFYPPKKLSLRDTPLVKGASKGIAYYAPWGDVVMFYKDYTGADGLYDLGTVISGGEDIEQLTGTIKIDKLQGSTKIKKQEENSMIHVEMRINNQLFSASLYDNQTVKELCKRLPMNITMQDLHNNEKFYYFSNDLPTSAQSITKIETGEIKLFGKDCLVLFYKDFDTSYSYTSIGKIDDPQGLKKALGTGDVKIEITQVKE